MSTINNITERIVQQAREQAQGIVKQAKEETSSQLLAHRREIGAAREKELERAEREASSMSERLLSGAELRSRDLQLSARQELLEKAFVQAKAALKDLRPEDYSAFLKKTLEEVDSAQGDILRVPANRLEEVQALGLSQNIEADESLESGFLLESENSRMNFDFSELIDFRRSEIERDVLSVLLEGKD